MLFLSFFSQLVYQYPAPSSSDPVGCFLCVLSSPRAFGVVFEGWVRVEGGHRLRKVLGWCLHACISARVNWRLRIMCIGGEGGFGGV